MEYPKKFVHISCITLAGLTLLNFMVLGPLALVSAIVAYFCAKKGYFLAVERRKNVWTGFIAGLLFSVVGLFFYWLFVR